MMTEMPFVNAAIARLPNAQTMIAAFGITASVSITIESPVIMLLASATALASHRQAYAVLRRFTIHLMLLTTGLTLAMGFTPLYEVVVQGWMGIPPAIAEAARPGLQIMTFWSAAIAWRRFKQGVMIRYGQTRLVGVGTIIRLTASAGTATLLALAFADRFTGVAVAGWALMAGVVAEAVYAHWAAAPVIAERLPARSDQPDLTYRNLLTFHGPLAAVSLLTLLGQPLVGAALARAQHPAESLAAWPVVFGLLGIFRSASYALPESVIALQRGPETIGPLRRFAYSVGLTTSGLLLLICLTPVAAWYLGTVIGIAPALVTLALPGVWLGVAMPFIGSAQSYLRGLLMGRRLTAPTYQAMMINLLVLALTLAVGVWQGWPGVALASGAITASQIVETAFLTWSVKRAS